MASADRPRIVVLDFGSQYSHLIVRRLRQLNVYSEMLACTASLAEVMRLHPKGIILSGGPASVFEEGSPHAPQGIWDTGLPILGICYGMQEMCHQLGGKVEKGVKREYGHATIKVQNNPLFEGIKEDFSVWMSHGDKVTAIPSDFEVVGVTNNCEFAAIYSAQRNMYAVQFHPEVTHSEHGMDILSNFVNISKCERDWSMTSFVDEAIESIRKQVGEDGRVIGAVSGGVDSTVAAVMMHKAIGSRFHAILVDNGVLRLDEASSVMRRLRDRMGINLHLVDATDLFLDNLANVEDPERKRKIIGNKFIEVFEAEAKRLGENFTFLLQGTLYPDVIESISFKGPSATIKTHHNVGGLLADMKLKLIEPLRELFKDEVRELGRLLSVDEQSINRHPFPGPGLAIRILGPVNRESLAILRQADRIYLEELHASGHYAKINQAFCVLLPVKSVGVMGDSRTYDQVIALRAVTTTDFMTADWYPMPYDVMRKISGRITNEVRGVNRVVYDVSSKPPSTIEWE
eukprot:TRINITY_DN4549_c0_g1_i1.p1 TRINITY_DN4549_c0_g1~~TRINITY_DN4549_c0_g1_i1.p1  ORF type:complete len:516 (+),score=136.05 TRINITY_DN4549_c0_g1_i1:51-1598(+)